MELQWSVRDIVLVYECHRVPYFRELCRTSFVAMTMLFPHTTQRMRIHVRLFSIDVLLVTPTETMFSKILFANFARMEFH